MINGKQSVGPESMDKPHIPFSQRTGLEPIPPQLEVGKISVEMRRLVDYYISLEIDRFTGGGYNGSYFKERWERVAQDMHVKFFKRAARSFKNKPYDLRIELAKYIADASLGSLFDFLEFLLRHPGCSDTLKGELAEAFVEARMAYRVVDRQIVAIGTEQQGEAFEAALIAAEKHGSGAARAHLVAAGLELRNGDWPGTVRESINAVEAVARLLAPGTTTLGPALAKLEAKGYLHGALKEAFKKLYGYTSDAEGIRHALVLEDKAQVDEADALFMLGACASFVSYLIARNLEGEPAK